MKRETLSKLTKLRDALLDNRVGTDEASLEDLKEITVAEVMDNRMWFSSKQLMEEMLGAYAIAMYTLNNDSLKDVIQAVNISIMLIASLPDNMDYIWTREWFRLKLGDEYNAELDEPINRIVKNKTALVFNYEFAGKYNEQPVEVFKDTKVDRPYVMYKGKRMYFPGKWNEEKIVHYVRFINAEQDKDSPHYYRMEGYNVKEGDVVIDAGVAEGNFALDVIDKVKKIYLVEADEEWIETLKITFKDYMDKVVFVRGYLDAQTKDDHYALKDIASEHVDYVKMDIEGFEKLVLEGSKDMLSDCHDMRMAVCTYHEDRDEERIGLCLKECGFETTLSKGYMFPTWEVACLYDCKFRRGVMFARKP